ncbi:Cytochrome P450 4C1 [Blattella germanica]|nr:Cytochrome P450 4C1 [Blattella germanica]
MLIVTALLAVLTLLALYATHHLLRAWRYMRKVEKLPSTKGHPIVGHVLRLMGPKVGILDALLEMWTEQQEFFTLWLGPIPVLIVIDPRLHELILGSQKHINKVPQYDFMAPWLGKGLLTSTGAKWQTHRKMLTPAFHFSILENFIDIFAEKSEILVNKLENELSSDDFDVFPYMCRCTLDIICETAMGVSINAQEVEQRSEYINAVSKECSRPGCRKKKLAFLDILLEASENGSKLTDEEIREEVDTFMFEGHDTTGAALSWALRLLGLNRDVQEKVYDELEGIFQGSDRVPTMKDLNSMKYLERVIKESLRKFPSVPIIGRVLKEDVEYDGYTIPAGLRVVHLFGLTHYHPDHYEDSMHFNPDNFLPEIISNRHPYAYVPFSAGPRNCIGQRFAILEEKVVLSYIIRNFKFEALGAEPNAIPGLVLRPDIGIHLKLMKRERSGSVNLYNSEE